jgi:hypothetical protein
VRYALVILRYGNVCTHPRFHETSGPGGSLIPRDLSIALPVPNQPHVPLYFVDIQSQTAFITIHPSFRNAARPSRVPRSSARSPRFPRCTHTRIPLYPCAAMLTILPSLFCTCLPRCTRCNSIRVFFSSFTTFSARVSRANSQQHPWTSSRTIPSRRRFVYYVYYAYPPPKKNFVPHNLPLQTFTYSPCSLGADLPSSGEQAVKSTVETLSGKSRAFRVSSVCHMRFHVGEQPF